MGVNEDDDPFVKKKTRPFLPSRPGSSHRRDSVAHFDHAGDLRCFEALRVGLCHLVKGHVVVDGVDIHDLGRIALQQVVEVAFVGVVNDSPGVLKGDAGRPDERHVPLENNNGPGRVADDDGNRLFLPVETGIRRPPGDNLFSQRFYRCEQEGTAVSFKQRRRAYMTKHHARGSGRIVPTSTLLSRSKVTALPLVSVADTSGY